MILGILGQTLGHSFSPDYFYSKFQKLGLANHSYHKFELDSVDEFIDLKAKEPSIHGLNVTIPYKSAIINYLDEIDPKAGEIGAVNTLLNRNGKWTGFNTDYQGFFATWKNMRLKDSPALILGSGGVSLAVQCVLKDLGISYQVVSRKTVGSTIGYEDIDAKILNKHKVIINTTPLGMFPNINQKAELPYRLLNEAHCLIDLIYNPRVTQFLLEGLNRGCRVKNGYEMLISQAEASWKIWQQG